METRETFAGLSTWQIALWYTLIVISTSIFAWGVIRLVIKYMRGRGAFPVDRPLYRAGRTAWIGSRTPGSNAATVSPGLHTR